MSELSPPKPPRADELEALIREARARQRRRRMAGAVALAAAAASAFVIYEGAGASPSSSADHGLTTPVLLGGGPSTAIAVLPIVGRLAQATAPLP